MKLVKRRAIVQAHTLTEEQTAKLLDLDVEGLRKLADVAEVSGYVPSGTNKRPVYRRVDIDRLQRTLGNLRAKSRR